MSKKTEPSTHGGSGRDASGKFSKGNTLGKGNPLAGRAAKIRAVLLDLMTEERAQILGMTLMVMAANGDLAAIKEIFDRTIGKASQVEILERLEKLEAASAVKEDGIWETEDGAE